MKKYSFILMDHDELNYQIKSGITEILLDHIFYGSVNQSGTDGWSRNRFNQGFLNLYEFTYMV